MPPGGTTANYTVCALVLFKALKGEINTVCLFKEMFKNHLFGSELKSIPVNILMNYM